ncbi:MAG: ATP-binding cassette domain-containing protein, partial [Alphaproteobacteria bacterium]|nr:ATP-binding cassette domain-containing protein [Alphaproteobacteria bacterium]
MLPVCGGFAAEAGVALFSGSRGWLGEMLRPMRGVFREALLMSLFINVLALATPVFTLQVYDRVVFYGGVTTMWGLVIGMMLVLAFDYVLRQARGRLLQRVALRLDVEVGRKLFDKVLALPLRQLESKPTAFWMTLFRDANQVRDVFSGPTAVLLVDLPFALLALVLTYVIAPAIAWVLPLMLAVYAVLAWRSGVVMDRLSNGERVAGQGRDAIIAEMLAGRSTVKALALDAHMRKLWEERHAEVIERGLVRGVTNDMYMTLGQSLALFATVLLTTVGAFAVLDQSVSIGGLIASGMLSSKIIAPFNQLFGIWRSLTGARQAWERLGQVFAATEERRTSAIEFDRPKGDIVLDGISFHYGGREPLVVDSVRVRIGAPGLHGVIGRNGSGKSTLLKLIHGLYPPLAGRVLIDGADISQFTRHELARWFGYVPQDCTLFAGSIRDNIVRGLELSDDDILRAARAAGVHDFVADMPDGYATDVGEGGQRLSAGQRQRIALARALVADPPVLLLDEPSSNFDRQAEEELARTLAELAKTRNIVLVTHSPALLAA